MDDDPVLEPPLGVKIGKGYSSKRDRRRLVARSKALGLTLQSLPESTSGSIVSEMSKTGCTVGKLLRGGSGSAALREVEADGKAMVLKFAPAGEGVPRLAAEYQILRALRHSCIVEACNWHTADNEAGFTMMRCPGSKFSEVVSHLAQAQSYSVARQLADAVTYLHSMSIAHRDLHAGNVIIHTPKDDRLTGSAQVFIIDFGSAEGPGEKAASSGSGGYRDLDKEHSNSHSSMFAGECTSPAILPPLTTELGMGNAIKRDVFALGLLFASLVRCTHTVTMDLFEGSDLRSAWWQPQPVTQQAVLLVEGLLDVAPGKRLSARQASNLLHLLEFWSEDARKLPPRRETLISL
eukprot:TRINITY_DN60570_c0_g1_i1.p1 TRINITY_DN60570_c0_g1~~TRINITY_DN60570_c0_g1_i1.p1  ORF type:complete len:360 (-),score=64.49 TRINITY_DN60570_c0_g1_i1:58-1107(-)